MHTIVVKVGGSLYDDADLAERLRQWLIEHVGKRVLIVPGGGQTADAIRHFDHVHHLGEEASHWLALRSLTVNAHFLAELLTGVPIVGHPDEHADLGPAILDMFRFAELDEGQPGCLPHTWDVTSDSLAVRVASVAHITINGTNTLTECLLLKSVNTSIEDWQDGVSQGIVDAYFPRAVHEAELLGVNIPLLAFRAEAADCDYPP